MATASDTTYAQSYQTYCSYRLPCGICTRTNSHCPLYYGYPNITWTASDQATINANGIYGGSTEGSVNHGSEVQ